MVLNFCSIVSSHFSREAVCLLLIDLLVHKINFCNLKSIHVVSAIQFGSRQNPRLKSLFWGLYVLGSEAFLSMFELNRQVNPQVGIHKNQGNIKENIEKHQDMKQQGKI